MKFTLKNKTIELTEEEVNEIIKQNSKSKPAWFVPGERETYYYITPNGVCRATKEDCEWDTQALSFHKVFKTEEEAEKELKRKQAETRVLKRIAEMNEGWIPDWDNEDEYKYSIDYSYGNQRLFSDGFSIDKCLLNDFYLKSKELAEQLISEMEEDLLIMLEVK